MPDLNLAKAYQIVLRGVVLAQETINTFYYAAAEDPSDMSAIAVGFDENVALYLQGCMNENASLLQIDVNQVKGGGYFNSLAISRQGTNGGDCLPPYASWDFTLIRAAVGERNGYKRIAGVGEGNQNNGIATTGILSALSAAADAMFAVLPILGVDLIPCVQRTRIHKLPVDPPKYFSISNVVYSKIGTQNSRKYGHGR